MSVWYVLLASSVQAIVKAPETPRSNVNVTMMLLPGVTAPDVVSVIDVRGMAAAVWVPSSWTNTGAASAGAGTRRFVTTPASTATTSGNTGRGKRRRGADMTGSRPSPDNSAAILAARLPKDQDQTFMNLARRRGQAAAEAGVWRMLRRGRQRQ